MVVHSTFGVIIPKFQRFLKTQQNLDTLRDQGKFEVLRMEVRINNRQKMKQLFPQLAIDTELTLKDLFDTSTAQSILLYYLDKIEQGRPALLDYKPSNDSDLLATLKIHNPKLSIQKLFAVYGLKKALDGNDLRSLRTIITGSSSSGNQSKNRPWYRLLAEVKNISLPNTQSPFVIIRTQLKEFKALRLKSFKKPRTRYD